MGIKDSSLWAREILSFLETAKNGSINGTAEANAMKQSNLSRTLKSLEEKLKCQLLERGYNGVRLTENGREVFKVACDLDKVIYKVKNFTISDKNVSGKIRLWTSDGLGTGYLSNCLSEFIAKYPDVKIEVVCSLDTPGSFSTTDMAVVYEEPEFDDGEIVSCYELQFGLFASMSYLSKFGYPNNIKDLQENHRICDRENYAGVWPQWKKIIDGARHVVATTNSSAMLLRMTCDGIGIGLHPIAIGKRERDLIHLSQLGIKISHVYIERSVSRMGAFVPLANFLNLFLQLNGVLGDPEPFRGRRTAQVGAFEQFGAGLFFQIIDYNAEIRGFHVVFFSGTADGFTADYFMKVKNSAD